MSKILLLSAILIPLAGAVTVFTWGHKNKKTVSIVNAVFTGATFAVMIGLYILFSKGQALRVAFDVGVPFKLALRADALGLFLGLLTTSIWFLVTIYNVEYLENNKGLFASFLQLSLYGMIGITLAENLFTLLLFFEIFSIASSILVMHKLTDTAVRAAFQYFFISVVGTGCLIVGTALLYNQTGSLDITGRGLSAVINSNLGVVAFWLLITGFAVKAGMFPAHIALPQAYPVSPSAAVALLSGVMTKAGAYGMIRIIYGVYGGHIAAPSMSTVLIVLSIITMLGGSIAAITQTEFKKMLAYSSIAQIGYVLLGMSLLSASALAGGILHILNHALMKSSLFLAVGAIIKKTGKRDLKDLKGIGRQMPITMTVITLAAISMIGVPPFLGFFSKWLLATGALQAVKTGVLAPWAAYTIIGVIILSGLLNVIYYGPIVINGWWGGKEPGAAHGHDEHKEHAPVKKAPLTEPSWVMVSPMLILASATLVMGIYIQYPLKLITSIVKMYF